VNLVNQKFPSITIIVPCLNEENTIQYLLEAIYNQTYPQQVLDVIIADGMSRDQTRQKIQQFSESHPSFNLTIIDNPKRTIPAALNKALQNAQGEIIVRLDAHSIPYPDYIEKAVAALQSGKGDNVGGVWEIKPGKSSDGKVTWVARSIAAASSNPFGVGNALYRYAKTHQEVDTVPFGVFRKQLVDDIGPFNETLLTNEDYEFNVRIKVKGGKVWLDPNIRSVYFSRSTFTDLFKQYWRYGYWKAQMLRNNVLSIRWRQAVPPLFIAACTILFVLSFWFVTAKLAFGFLLGIYSMSLILAGIYETVERKDSMLLIGFPIAVLCMHIAWGSAFWWSLITSLSRNISTINFFLR
jgi:succinoglycan biosynthesis protein ExoA